MELSNLINFVEEFTAKFANNTAIVNLNNLWNQIKTQTATNVNGSTPTYVNFIEGLKTNLSTLNINLSKEEEEILDTWDLTKFVKGNGHHFLTEIQNQITSNPAQAPNIIQKVVTDITQNRAKPIKLNGELKPFKIKEQISLTQGVLEIIFQGNTEISNISNGKDQFEDWFLIIDGYASIFNIRREDFEIIGISKNSPVKIKLRTTLEIASFIMTIVAGIIVIEQRFSGDRILIEQLKSRTLIESEAQQTFIKTAEEQLSISAKKEVDRLVKEKLNERKINTAENGHIQASFNKGIETQYNFIINGGDVKFILNDPAETKKAQELELLKEGVKEIRRALIQTKSINDNKSDEGDNTEHSSSER